MCPIIFLFFALYCFLVRCTMHSSVVRFYTCSRFPASSSVCSSSSCHVWILGCCILSLTSVSPWETSLNAGTKFSPNNAQWWTTTNNFGPWETTMYSLPRPPTCFFVWIFFIAVALFVGLLWGIPLLHLCFGWSRRSDPWHAFGIGQVLNM